MSKGLGISQKDIDANAKNIVFKLLYNPLADAIEDLKKN